MSQPLRRPIDHRLWEGPRDRLIEALMENLAKAAEFVSSIPEPTFNAFDEALETAQEVYDELRRRRETFVPDFEGNATNFKTGPMTLSRLSYLFGDMRQVAAGFNVELFRPDIPLDEFDRARLFVAGALLCLPDELIRSVAEDTFKNPFEMAQIVRGVQTNSAIDLIGVDPELIAGIKVYFDTLQADSGKAETYNNTFEYAEFFHDARLIYLAYEEHFDPSYLAYEEHFDPSNFRYPVYAESSFFTKFGLMGNPFSPLEGVDPSNILQRLLNPQTRKALFSRMLSNAERNRQRLEREVANQGPAAMLLGGNIDDARTTIGMNPALPPLSTIPKEELEERARMNHRKIMEEIANRAAYIERMEWRFNVERK